MRKKWIIGICFFIMATVLTFFIVNFLYLDSEVPNRHYSFISKLEVLGPPDFQSKTIDGKKFSIKDFRGKIVILNFWASWCSPCVEELPSLLNLVKHMNGDVILVAVSSDYNLDEIRSFLKSFKINIPENIFIVLDSESHIRGLYEVEQLPESFVFNREFKLSKKVIGSVNWSSEDAISYFKTL